MTKTTRPAAPSGDAGASRYAERQVERAAPPTLVGSARPAASLHAAGGRRNARQWVVAKHLSLVRTSAPGDPGPDSPLQIGCADLGRIVSAAALSIWGEAESRAELSLQIDCVGPVVADERRLVRLLRDLSRYLLSGLPAGPSVGHVLRIRSRCHGPQRARVEVRTMLRGADSLPSLPAMVESPPDPRLEQWAAVATSFGGVLHAESGAPPRALLIELQLADL